MIEVLIALMVMTIALLAQHACFTGYTHYVEQLQHRLYGDWIADDVIGTWFMHPRAHGTSEGTISYDGQLYHWTLQCAPAAGALALRAQVTHHQRLVHHRTLYVTPP